VSTITHNHVTITVHVEMWSAQPTTGEKPPPLAGHTFTKVSDHKAVVFGGITGRMLCNDAYVLDTQTWV